MNKSYIDAVIVVEGKSDVSYLSSFIDAEFFITNGYDINEEKLDFLNRVSKINNVIVFTDNDQAGEKIENVIKSRISGVISIKTAKNIRKNYKKVGVAETKKEEILKVLQPYIKQNSKENQVPKYNLTKVISLSNNPQELKEKIINNYRLINGNNNYLEKQLRMLKISEEEFKQ